MPEVTNELTRERTECQELRADVLRLESTLVIALQEKQAAEAERDRLAAQLAKEKSDSAERANKIRELVSGIDGAEYWAPLDAVAHLAKQVRTHRIELAEARKDTARLDWLEGEMRREKESFAYALDSLFRRNQPVTRAAIDAAMEGK